MQFKGHEDRKFCVRSHISYRVGDQLNENA